MVFAPQGKHTLSHRVFVTIFVCAMAVIVAFTVLGAFFVQNTLADATSANLAQETELIAAALDEQQEPIPFLRSLDREDLRITLINKDGSVAYDNEASPSTLPNHGDRPEVIEAFESGSGSAERASSTLDEIMLYRAVTLDNGQVVRLAQAQPGVAAILLSMLAPMLLIAAAGAVLSFFMARVSPAPSSRRCKRWIWITHAVAMSTPMPRWSPCLSASSRSARNSSAKWRC